MAKKRKGTTKKPGRTSARSKRTIKVQATPAQLGKRARAGKHSSEDNVTALVIAVAIVIFLASLYLYQQNAKPKTSQLDLTPTVTLIKTT